MSNAAPSHYETVAAGQTAQVLGNAGSAGDFIDTLTLVVTTAATAQVDILDNATSINVFPNSPGGGVGTYVLPVNLKSQKGPWKVTTGAGVAVIASGNFT
jgi:hypothetical protein